MRLLVALFLLASAPAAAAPLLDAPLALRPTLAEADLTPRSPLPPERTGPSGEELVDPWRGTYSAKQVALGAGGMFVADAVGVGLAYGVLSLSAASGARSCDGFICFNPVVLLVFPALAVGPVGGSILSVLLAEWQSGLRYPGRYMAMVAAVAAQAGILTLFYGGGLVLMALPNAFVWPGIVIGAVVGVFIHLVGSPLIGNIELHSSSWGPPSYPFDGDDSSGNGDLFRAQPSHLDAPWVVARF